jgi:hypothetical protein
MNAGHDKNHKSTIIGVSNVNGTTIIPIYGNPATKSLKVDDNTTGSDYGNNQGIAMIDENRINVATALSSADDGSIIELYGDPITNKLLINSQ